MSKGKPQKGPGQKVPRLVDAEELIALIRRGWSHAQIAKERGMRRQQVTHEVTKLLRELKESRYQELEIYVTKQLEELAEMKKQAWEAWEKSKTVSWKRVEEKNVPLLIGPRLNKDEEEEDEKGKKGKKKGKKVEQEETEEPPLYTTRVTETQEGQCGDPRYLAVIERCLQREAELLSLIPDKKPTVNANVVQINWDGMSRPPGVPAITAENDPIEARINSVGTIPTQIVQGIETEKRVEAEVISTHLNGQETAPAQNRFQTGAP